MKMQLTDEQRACVDAIAQNKSILIEACAGSGKTSTLIAGINDSRRDNSDTTLLAFNRHTKEELLRKVDVSVEVLTVDGLAYRAWCSHIGKRFIDTSRHYQDLFHDFVGDETAEGKVDFTRRVERIFSGTEEPTPQDEELLEKIDGFAKQGIIARGWLGIFPYLCNRHNALSYYGWERDIVIDEAQDLSISQLKFISSLKTRGVVAVGDRYQNIYEWRGASENGMDILANIFGLDGMQLSFSFRCPALVVAEARNYHPFITALPNAPAGAVVGARRVVGQGGSPTTQIEGLCGRVAGVVLARVNATLMSVASQLMREGRKFRWKNKDMEMVLRRYSKSAFPQKQLERDWEKAKEKDNLYRLEQLSAVRVALNQETPLKDLVKRMEEEQSGLLLATPHYFKGKENPTVYLCPDLFVRKGVAEDRVRYVAITRSQDTLHYL